MARQRQKLEAQQAAEREQAEWQAARAAEQQAWEARRAREAQEWAARRAAEQQQHELQLQQRWAEELGVLERKLGLVALHQPCQQPAPTQLSLPRTAEALLPLGPLPKGASLPPLHPPPPLRPEPAHLGSSFGGSRGSGGSGGSEAPASLTPFEAEMAQLGAATMALQLQVGARTAGRQV